MIRYPAIAMLLFFLSSCNYVIKKDFFLPKGFKGEVAIVYEYPTGNAVTVKDGRQQFEVPASGIVLTSAANKYGKIDYKFYIKNNKQGFDELTPYLFQKDEGHTKYIYNIRNETEVCAIRKDKSTGYVMDIFTVGKETDSIANSSSFKFKNRLDRMFGCQ